MSEEAGAPAPVSTPTPSAAPSAPATSATAAPTNSQSATPSTPDSSAPAVNKAAPETQSEKRARKLKLKIDGAEEEYDLDSTDDMTLTRDLQMSRAAQKRMQEAAEMRKEIVDLFSAMEKDPLNTLTRVNPKLKEAIRQRIEDEILEEAKQAQMTPEQRQAYEDRQFRERYEKERAESERDAAARTKREAEEAEFQRHQKEVEDSFISALEEGGLPKDRYVVAQMAQVAKEASRVGVDLTPAQLAHETKLRMQNQHKIITNLLKGDKLVAHLGDEVVKEVIRYTLEKAKANKAAELTVQPPEAAPVEVEEDAEFTEETPKKKDKKFDAQAFWRKSIRGF